MKNKLTSARDSKVKAEFWKEHFYIVSSNFEYKSLVLDFSVEYFTVATSNSDSSYMSL